LRTAVGVASFFLVLAIVEVFGTVVVVVVVVGVDVDVVVVVVVVVVRRVFGGPGQKST
jgi:hypothetical protein